MNHLYPILSTWRRAGPVRRLQFALIGLTGLYALARVVWAFDVDALIIAALSVLLIWVMAVEQVRRDEIGHRLDDLLNLQRYGPLSDDDRETIAALRSGAPGPPHRRHLRQPR